MAASQQFGGVEHFAAPPQRVYEVLTDLVSLDASIPERVASRRVDDNTLHVTVRPGFSFLRGTMKLTITLVDRQPPHSATMRIQSEGIGTSMEIESRLEVAPDEQGSRLEWQANVIQMKGLVATISPGLIRAAAEQVITRGWQNARVQIEGAKS